MSERGTSKRPTGALAAVALALAILCGLVFSVVLALVLAHTAAGADRSALLQIHRDAPSSLKPGMILLSKIAGPGGMAAIVAICALFFLARRMVVPALLVVVGLGGAQLLETVLKRATARARPELWSGTPIEHSYSFPSGHATAVAAATAALCLALWFVGSRAAAVVAGVIGGIVALAVGFSRLFLGVHWPSDVVGGYALGLAWASLVVLLAVRLTR